MSYTHLYQELFALEADYDSLFSSMSHDEPEYYCASQHLCYEIQVIENILAHPFQFPQQYPLPTPDVLPVSVITVIPIDDDDELPF